MAGVNKDCPFTIRELQSSDADAVLRIYQQGIDTGHATFQEELPSWEEWDASHLETPRLGAFIGETLAGWAMLSPTSSRCVFTGVAEESVYIGKEYGGRGIGFALLEALSKASEEQGIWTLLAGIFPENEASVKLHLKAGFRIVGTHLRHARLDGDWRDVVTVEKLLNQA